MNTVKKIIASLSCAAILFGMVPSFELPVAHAAGVPSGAVFYHQKEFGQPANKLYMHIGPNDAGAESAALNLATTYQIVDLGSGGAEVAIVNGNNVMDVSSEGSEGHTWEISFAAEINVTGPGLAVNVDFEGGGADFVNRNIFTHAGSIAIDTYSKQLPYVFEAGNGGLNNSAIGIFFDPTWKSPQAFEGSYINNYTYTRKNSGTPEGELASPGVPALIDFSANVGGAYSKSIYILDFDEPQAQAGAMDFIDGVGDVIPSLTVDIVGQGQSWTNVPINTFADFQSMTLFPDPPPPPSTVALTLEGSQDITENGAQGVFRITASPAVPGDLTVNFTLSGDAVKGTDFSIDKINSVVIPANGGVATSDITVTGINNDDEDGSRTVILTIDSTSNPGFSIVGAQQAITITDDDGVPPAPPSAGLATWVGTPKASDLNFAEGSEPLAESAAYGVYSTDGTFNTKPTYKHATQDFFMFWNGVGKWLLATAVPGTPLAQMTPPVDLDDPGGNWESSAPPPPNFTVAVTSPPSISENEAAGVFTITAAESVPGDLTVNYTLSGTAVKDTDFTVIQNGSIVIPANIGQATGEVNITAINNQDLDGNKTVILTIDSTSDQNFNVAGDPATITITDDEAPVVPEITINTTPVTIQEYADGTPVNIVVTASESVSGNLDVSYTVDGTATNTDDYQTLSQKVTILDGQTTENIVVTPVDDAFDEGMEDIAIILGQGAGYTVGEDDQATVKIADDDKPEVKVSSAPGTNAVGELNPQFVKASISFIYLVPEVGVDYTVAYSLTGTATSGVDYTVETPSPVTLNSVTPLVDVAFTTVTDPDVEGDETVIVTIPVGADYTVGSGLNINTTTLTIVDAEAPPPTVSISVEEGDDANEDGTVGTFTFTSSEVADGDITIDYQIDQQNITATSGVDFEALSGSVILLNGQTVTTVLVTPINDDFIEGREEIVLIVNDGEGYVAGQPNNAVMALDDDDAPSTIALQWMVPNPGNSYNLGPIANPIGPNLGIRANYTIVVGINGGQTSCSGDEYTLEVTHIGTGTNLESGVIADPATPFNALGMLGTGAGTYTAVATCESSQVTSDPITATLLPPCPGDLCVDVVPNGADYDGTFSSTLVKSGETLIELGIGDLAEDGGIALKPNSVITTAQPWTGVADINFTEIAEPLSATFTSFLSEGTQVDITPSVDQTMRLNDEAIILMPNADFAAYATPKVWADGRGDIGLYEVAECTGQYSGAMEGEALGDADNWSVAVDSSCYFTFEGDVVIGSRHFSSFAAGEGTGQEVGALKITGYGPEDGATVGIWAPIGIFFEGDVDPEGNIYPLTNTTDSAVSVIDSATQQAITGFWQSFSESWGEETFYRVTFFPTDGQGNYTELPSSTNLETRVAQTYAGGTDFVFEQDAEFDSAEFSFAITTSGGGIEWIEGEDIDWSLEDQGGASPPYVDMVTNYLTPEVNTLMLKFDRPMDVGTLQGDGNISLWKLVGGVESEEITVNVTPTTGAPSKFAYITMLEGADFVEGADYRVKVTRDVTDPSGNRLAGMPQDDNGEIIEAFGIGYENMGPFIEDFSINPSTAGSGVTVAQMGDSIADKQTASVSNNIKIYFNGQLEPTLVNTANVSFSPSIDQNIKYDPDDQAIVLSQLALNASTSYSLNWQNIKSSTGQSVAAGSIVFTTGTADTTKPQLSYAEADNYGFIVKFNESLNVTKAEQKANYTIKTCSGTGFENSTTCADASSPTSLNILDKGVRYEEDSPACDYGPCVMMDGFTLTPDDGFYVEASVTGITDVAGNALDNTAYTSMGTVYDASAYTGGQGMFNMGNIGFEDQDMDTWGMTPTNVSPTNQKALTSSIYYVDLPTSVIIPAGGYVGLTFPAGFDTANAIPADSPINWRIASTDVTGTGITAGGAADDGVSVKTGSNSVLIKIAEQTSANDYLSFDLDTITAGAAGEYQIGVKTYDASGGLLEAMTASPFYIQVGGAYWIYGTVTSEGSPLEGIEVYKSSPSGNFESTLTNVNGDYSFTSLKAGDYYVGVDSWAVVDGIEYSGPEHAETMKIVDAQKQKNWELTQISSSNTAILNLEITGDIAEILSLGHSDSIDIFWNSWTESGLKTLTRSELEDHIADSEANPVTIKVSSDVNIGISPAFPQTYGSFKEPEFEWIPPQNKDIPILQSHIDGSEDLDPVTFTITSADKEIHGLAQDTSGNPIANVEVFAYSSEGGGNHDKTTANGEFEINVAEGKYKVGAFMPGLPQSVEVMAEVIGSNVYIANSTTASTGASGENPFIIKLSKSGSLTISGKVLDAEGNGIPNAAVWGWNNDGPGYANTSTDSTGLYTIYVTAGTWTVEADSSGYIGSKGLTVGSESLSGQNFEVSSSKNTLSGTVTGPSIVSGIQVWACGMNGCGNAVTDENGFYTMNVLSGTYDAGAYSESAGDLGYTSDLSVTGDTTLDFESATPQTVTATIKDDQGNAVVLSEGASINFFSTDSPTNKNMFIPAGNSTATGEIQSGSYYVDMYIPGVPWESIIFTGASYNNGEITVNGSETITITIADLRTISGTVTDSSENAIEGAWVSVFDDGQGFGVTTDSSGAYSIKVRETAGIKIMADSFGYGSTEYTLPAAGNATQNFVMDSFGNMITGTVYDTSSDPVANAHVWAEEAATGSFSWAETDASGYFQVPVPDTGSFTMYSQAKGYAVANSVVVNVATDTLSGNDFTYSQTETVEDPMSSTMNTRNGGTINDPDASLQLTIPGGTLTKNDETASLSASETNAVFATSSAAPVGNGIEILAYDSNNVPITDLEGNIEISIDRTLADLVAAGVTSKSDVDSMVMGYLDSSTGGWGQEPATKTYYDASGNTIKSSSITSLADASVASVKITASTSHLTTFAPIVPVGDTPPATPSGLSGVAGDTMVTLTWTANGEADMDYYNIWEANVTEGILTTQIHADCVGICTKNITGLTNDTEYAFQILAVDDGANSSAGSSSVSVTPVAEPTGEVVTPSGGGVVLPSGGSGRSSSQKSEEETIAEFILETAKDMVDISAIGVIQDATTIISDDEVIKVTFEENTTILDGEMDLSAGIPAPEIAENVNTAAPEGAEFVGDIYEIGVADVGVVFSKPVTLRMALPEGYDEDDNLKAYYLDEENDIWILVEDGGEIVEIDDVFYVEVDTYHLTKFTIMELLEEVADAEPAETPVVEVDAAIFEDITAHWARPFIEKLYDSGIVSGATDTTFEPDAPITRAEVAKLSVKGFELDLLVGTVPAFEDVAKTDWYSTYVVTAEANGVVNGYDDGTFKPDAPVTRAEALKMFMTGSDLELGDVDYIPFDDIEESAWYTPYIVTGFNLGVVSGIDEDSFAPDQPVTRAEASKMLNKTMKLKKLRDLLLKWKF